MKRPLLGLRPIVMWVASVKPGPLRPKKCTTLWLSSFDYANAKELFRIIKGPRGNKFKFLPTNSSDCHHPQGEMYQDGTRITISRKAPPVSLLPLLEHATGVKTTAVGKPTQKNPLWNSFQKKVFEKKSIRAARVGSQSLETTGVGKIVVELNLWRILGKRRKRTWPHDSCWFCSRNNLLLSINVTWSFYQSIICLSLW